MSANAGNGEITCRGENHKYDIQRVLSTVRRVHTLREGGGTKDGTLMIGGTSRCYHRMFQPGSGFPAGRTGANTQSTSGTRERHLPTSARKTHMEWRLSAEFIRTRDEFIALLDLGDLVRKPVRNLSLSKRMKMEIAGSLLWRN